MLRDIDMWEVVFGLFGVFLVILALLTLADWALPGSPLGFQDYAQGRSTECSLDSGCVSIGD